MPTLISDWSYDLKSERNSERWFFIASEHMYQLNCDIQKVNYTRSGMLTRSFENTTYCCALHVCHKKYHYSDVIMSVMPSWTTGVSIVYSNVSSGADQRKHQSSASLALVTRKMFPFDDVIMIHRVLFWFGFDGLISSTRYRVTSLSLGKSCGCPGAIEATLTKMGE